MSHIQNIDEKEWTNLKWFVRGFVACYQDIHRKDWQDRLDDLWYGWDNTLDLNFLVDGDTVTCTAYSIAPNGYTDPSDFEQVYFNDTDEVLA